MARYKDIGELMKSISPDVQIEDMDTGQEIIERNVPASVPAQNPKKTNSNAKVLEDKFLNNWKALGGPDLEREYAFHPTRKWRFDFANPGKRIAFEIQGGLYAPESGHRSFQGVTRDYEKLNEAQLGGWIVIQLTSKMLQNATYLEGIIAFMNQTEIVDNP